MSEAKIPLAGVIGCPIAHSKSPQIHGHWLKTYGIQGHYVPMHVEPEDLEATLRQMPKMGFVGANVTIPHKEAVMEIADLVTDRAKLIGAANTLIFREDGSIVADNTDGYGFIFNLHQGAPDWDPKAGPATVIGAGGAARAVVASLIEAGTPEIRVTNRTRARADQFREEFGEKITVVDWVEAGLIIEDARAGSEHHIAGYAGSETPAGAAGWFAQRYRCDRSGLCAAENRAAGSGRGQRLHHCRRAWYAAASGGAGF